MPVTFLLEILPKLLTGVVLSLLLFFGYQHIKQNGYEEGYSVASQKYEEVIAANQKEINKKIENIESLASNLATLNTTANEKLTEHVASILDKIKGKSLVIVKNGECTPSPTFSDSLAEINKRVNQNMKETQK